MSEAQTSIKVKADIMWAQLDKVNEMSGKFQVDLCNLSDAAVAALEEMGITVPEKEGRGKYITCKSANPIKAFDNDGDEIVGVKVGNGSKAKAVITAYEWKYKNKKGVSPSIRKLVITDLIEYDSGGAVDLSDDEVL